MLPLHPLPGRILPYLGIWGRAARQGMVFWPRCPKQGVQFDLALSLRGSEPVLNRAWYYEPRDVNTDCKQSLSFPSLREVRLKDHAIERRTTSGALLFLICIISTELKRQLSGHYNVINQHQIILLLLSASFNLNYFSTYQYYSKRALTEPIVPVGLVSLSWIT